MPFTLLPALQPRDKHAVIQVHVSRKWEFRGVSDDGAPQHIDMVLTDQQGNAIYAEIPGDLAEEKDPLIQQDKVYIISRFKVTTSKSICRPVDTKFMIEFTCYTTIRHADNPPTTFPKYVYRLTPFDQIEMHLGSYKNFLDVLGMITTVHSLQSTYISGQAKSTVIRDVIIKDLKKQLFKWQCGMQLVFQSHHTRSRNLLQQVP